MKNVYVIQIYFHFKLTITLGIHVLLYSVCGLLKRTLLTYVIYKPISDVV